MTIRTHAPFAAAITLCIAVHAQAQVAYVSSENDHA